MGYLFLLPPVAAIVLFVVLWQSDLLRHPWLVAAWILAGLLLQFVFGGGMFVWLTGLLVNGAVAFYLSVRLNLS
jgi:hypothetical protein